jgi:hypothetical protein
MKKLPSCFISKVFKLLLYVPQRPFYPQPSLLLKKPQYFLKGQKRSIWCVFMHININFHQFIKLKILKKTPTNTAIF